MTDLPDDVFDQMEHEAPWQPDPTPTTATAWRLDPHAEQAVYLDAAAERRRAHAKHGPNSMESLPVDSLLRYTILAEEVGEVAKEFNEAETRGGLEHLDLDALHTELIQVIAMATSWAAAIDAAQAGR